jgi:hypothetical protein
VHHGQVQTLALKLLVTPALIGAASLAGRRWGPAVGGWLVGLPFTSAPVVLFLAAGQGPAFAAAAAAGTLAGTISQAAFCLAYAWTARLAGWPAALAAGAAAFGVATTGLGLLAVPPLAVFLAVVLALVVTLRLLPGDTCTGVVNSASRAAWDLPARMIVATAFVLLLTGVAPLLGARLTGLLTPFPLYAAVLTVFAHRVDGAGAAAGVLRGLCAGLFGFTVFFLALAVLLEPAGLNLAFAGATAGMLLVQAASLLLLRRSRSRPAAAAEAGRRSGA